MSLPDHLVEMADTIIGRIEWNDSNKNPFSASIYLNEGSYDAFHKHLEQKLKAHYNSQYDELQNILGTSSPRIRLHLSIKPKKILSDKYYRVIGASGADCIYYEQD